MRTKDGLRACARECHKKNKCCTRIECRMWIDFPTEQNCCLISVYENGDMTLREVGDRIGVSFARIKQIQTEALRKIKKHPLINE